MLQSSTNSQKWREFNWTNLIKFTPYIKSKEMSTHQISLRLLKLTHTGPGIDSNLNNRFDLDCQDLQSIIII